jgi:hypothetical protein
MATNILLLEAGDLPVKGKISRSEYWGLELADITLNDYLVPGAPHKRIYFGYDHLLGNKRTDLIGIEFNSADHHYYKGMQFQEDLRYLRDKHDVDISVLAAIGLSKDMGEGVLELNKDANETIDKAIQKANQD